MSLQQATAAGEAVCAPDRLVYLDEATTSWPKAPGVVEAVTASLAFPPGLPGREEGAPLETLAQCREKLARLLSVPDPDRVRLTAGATHALSLAIFGLGRYHGAQVIVSCAAHASVLMPLYYLQSHKRIHLRILGLTPDGDIDAEAFRSFLDRRTSLVVLSHASNVTGRVLNVGPLFAAAREAGAITLLNAAQTIGEIPVRPTELHADIVAFTGHKRLRGPGGTGGLYVAPHVSLAFSPSDTSVSRLALSPAGYMPLGMMDTATPAVSDFSGLLAALRWHEDQGERCRSEGIRIGALLRRGLKRIPRARVVGDAKRAQRIPIVSFVIPGLPALEVASILARQFGIRCGAGLHCAPLIHKALGTKPDGTVRFSVSGFNTEDDIRRALSAVRSIVAQQRKRSTD